MSGWLEHPGPHIFPVPTPARPCAHLGGGKGMVSSWPCAGCIDDWVGGSNNRVGVMRVKQRESEPNRKACSWVILRVAPAEDEHVAS